MGYVDGFGPLREKTYRHRILVVDNNQEYAKLISDILSREGYDVDEANSGRQGFRMARNVYNEFPPCALVTTELKMPNWDGVDLIISIGITSPDTPVLVVSEDKGIYEEECSSESNVVGFLQKPFNPEKLVSTVNEIISKKYGRV